MTKVRRVVNPRFYVWHFIACKRRQYPFFLGMSNCEAIKTKRSIAIKNVVEAPAIPNHVLHPCQNLILVIRTSKKRKHIPEIWNMRTVKGFAKAIKTKTNRAKTFVVLLEWFVTLWHTVWRTKNIEIDSSRLWNNLKCFTLWQKTIFCS